MWVCVPRSADFARVVDSFAQGVDIYGGFLSSGQGLHRQLALTTQAHQTATAHLRQRELGLATEILSHRNSQSKVGVELLQI